MKKGIIAFALAFGFTYVQAQDDTTSYQFEESYHEKMTETSSEAQDTTNEFSFEGQQYEEVIAPEGKDYVCVKEAPDSISQEELEFEGMTESPQDTSKSQEFARDNQAPDVLIEESQKTDITIERGEPTDVEVQEGQAQMDQEQKTEEEQEEEFFYEEEEVIQEEIEIDSAMEQDQAYGYETEAQDSESTLENIVEAPFKYVGTVVGDVAEGAGHIVYAPVKGAAYVVKGVGEALGEAGEGVGHIVYAPVKGVVDLFRSDDDKDKDAQMEAEALEEQEMFVEPQPEDEAYQFEEGQEMETSVDVEVEQEVTPADENLETDEEYYEERLFEENLDVSEDEFIYDSEEDELIEIQEYEDVEDESLEY